MFPKTLLWLSCAVLFCGVCLSAAEFKLMENKEPVCTIVLGRNAGPVEKHAAEELALFLGKISGGKKPSIADAAEKGKYPVLLELTQDKQVKEDGFRIEANPKGLHIAGKNPIGVLYGVYEILKKYGGIRWLMPGDEGEYFTPKATIAVPEGVTVKNPDFLFRDINAVNMGITSPIKDTRDWGVRNNMHFQVYECSYNNNLEKILIPRGADIKATGGFNPLVFGTDRKQIEKIFAAHPEYFPLIHGKRTITYTSGCEPQPCTTNPDVIKMAAANAIRLANAASKPHKRVYMEFSNNDCTSWCQCPPCRAIDPPQEQDKGVVSTRYWTFFNAVLNEIYKTKQEKNFIAWTYQNFSLMPEGIKPDKRAVCVMISNHRRCWKHALNDENCPSNRWYYTYNKSWNENGTPCFTYDMLSKAGNDFLPNEKSWVDTLKFYKKSMPNIAGMQTEITPPDGILRPSIQTFRNVNNWRMMWQSMYMGMYFQWDVHADYDEVNEEINALFYGKGWAGGMRQFRAYLTELYLKSPGCWGYGHSSPVGKFLDIPDARKKLEHYLNEAEQAAAKDSDPRALKHVKEDREFFEKTWIKAYQDYINNYREITAYPKKGNITIDGVLKESDWQNADVNTRFITPYGKPAKHQTAVRLTYDSKNIYIGIECMEPMPDRLTTNILKHDGPVWEDNDIELFINDPIMGGAYYQICINAAGVVCDGSVSQGQKGITTSYESGAEVKTSIAKDRWFAEIRIPSQMITGETFHAGNILKLNVMRCRLINGNPNESESSTWSIGMPHNVDTFHPVNFADSRRGADSRTWKNGSFDECDVLPVRHPISGAVMRKMPENWKVPGNVLPKFWHLSSNGGQMEYLTHPDSPGNRFIRLRSGFLLQGYDINSDKIRVSCRVRGKGTLSFGVVRYIYQKGRMVKCLGTVLVKTEKLNSTEWKPLSFEFKRPGDQGETHALAIFAMSPDAEIDIDNVFLRR